MMPDLAKYPPWADYLAREAELTKRIDATRAALRVKAARNADVRAAWQAERAEAHAVGQPAPPEPRPPEDVTPESDLLAELTRRRPELGPHRTRALTAIAADVEAEWRETLPELVADLLATPFGRLTDRLAEVRAWLTVLRECRRAVERADPNSVIVDGPSARMRDRIDPKDLWDLGDGIDLCAAQEPAPAPETEPTPLAFTQQDDGSVRLGLEPYRAFGTPPAMRAVSHARPGEI